MARKSFSAEQIVAKLREIEVLMAQGKTAALACKEAGISVQSYCPLAQGIWRSQARSGQTAEGAGTGERPIEACSGRSHAGESHVKGVDVGKLLSPERRRQAVEVLRRQFPISERVACQVVGQPCTTQRYQPILRQDEDALTQAIVSLAEQYGRYGYRRITALLQGQGWTVGRDRVQRI